MKAEIIVMGGFTLLMTMALLLLSWNQSIECHRQWERSGFNHEWNLMGGCVVQRKDGTWLPAKAFVYVVPAVGLNQ